MTIEKSGKTEKKENWNVQTVFPFDLNYTVCTNFNNEMDLQRSAGTPKHSCSSSAIMQMWRRAEKPVRQNVSENTAGDVVANEFMFTVIGSFGWFLLCFTSNHTVNDINILFGFCHFVCARIIYYLFGHPHLLNAYSVSVYRGRIHLSPHLHRGDISANKRIYVCDCLNKRFVFLICYRFVWGLAPFFFLSSFHSIGRSFFNMLGKGAICSHHRFHIYWIHWSAMVLRVLRAHIYFITIGNDEPNEKNHLSNALSRCSTHSIYIHLYER